MTKNIWTPRRTKTSDRPPEPYLLYFAYGANLSLNEIRRRCPKSRPLSSARLNDYSLHFALPQESPSGPGWATVISDPGKYVPGALFRLHPNDLQALDEYEDYPKLYLREEVWIETEKGTETAMAYRMREPLRSASPTPTYLETLKKGYRDFVFPGEVIEAALQRTQREDI